MTILTVWEGESEVKLAQLSDEPNDGSADEQIAHLSTLSAYQGFSCVSDDYNGPVPEVDPSLWRWNGNEIISVTPVPDFVTPRQVRLLLLQQNLLDEVESMISQQNRQTQIAWEFALEFRRNDPILLQIAESLGLSADQLDEFFIMAAQI